MRSAVGQKGVIMAMLETVAALAFVYALLSVVASAFKELLEAAVQRRKKDLKGALEDLLSPEGALALLKQGPIQALMHGSHAGRRDDTSLDRLLQNYRQWPSYIEPATFAQVALHMRQLNELKDCKFTDALVHYSGRADELARHVEQLYTQRMERLGGSFKRNAQWWLLGLGMLCAVVMDADTLRLARDLGQDQTRRAMVTAMAQHTVTLDQLKTGCSQQQGLHPDELKPDQLLACVDASLPGVLGWSAAEQERLCRLWQRPGAAGTLGLVWALLLKLIGYLLTAAAVSMGAPFWFDVLNKVSNLRSTLKPLVEDRDKQKSAIAEQK